MSTTKRHTTTRLRKVTCERCGYTVRMARSWMEVGLPVCPCGTEMRPTEGADLAWLGLIGQDDMPAPMWTQICLENGWEDCIVRKGNAAKTWSTRRKQIRTDPAGHCAFPGCGRWIADGADRCGAGHPQHNHVAEPELAATPF